MQAQRKALQYLQLLEPPRVVSSIWNQRRKKFISMKFVIFSVSFPHIWHWYLQEITHENHFEASLKCFKWPTCSRKMSGTIRPCTIPLLRLTLIREIPPSMRLLETILTPLLLSRPPWIKINSDTTADF